MLTAKRQRTEGACCMEALPASLTRLMCSFLQLGESVRARSVCRRMRGAIDEGLILPTINLDLDGADTPRYVCFSLCVFSLCVS